MKNKNHYENISSPGSGQIASSDQNVEIEVKREKGKEIQEKVPENYLPQLNEQQEDQQKRYQPVGIEGTEPKYAQTAVTPPPSPPSPQTISALENGFTNRFKENEGEAIQRTLETLKRLQKAA